MYARHILALNALLSLFALVGCAGPADEPAAASDQHLDESTVVSLCGGGPWLSSIPRFDGLAGSFTAANETQNIRSVSFDVTSAADELRATGSFQAKDASGAALGGNFTALPDNAAFSTSIFFEPKDGAGQIYYVLGVQRSDSGEISALCVEHMIDSAHADPIYVLTRDAK